MRQRLKPGLEVYFFDTGKNSSYKGIVTGKIIRLTSQFAIIDVDGHERRKSKSNVYTDKKKIMKVFVKQVSECLELYGFNIHTFNEIYKELITDYPELMV